MRQSYHSIANYVDKATELGENIKRCLQKKDRKIDDEAVLALNQFIIAANKVSEFMKILEEERKHIN